MSGLLIIPRLPMVAQIASTGSGQTNLMTASPREVWTPNPNVLEHAFEVDFGSVRQFDAIHLTVTSTAPPNISAVRTQPSGANPVALAALTAMPCLAGSTWGMIAQFASTASRYVYFTITIPGPAPRPFSVNTVTIGKSFEHPYAYGSGRQLIDTSRRTDLVDGGFGIEHGVSKAGFRWRFIDLDDEARETLWILTYAQGQRRPVVVVEDADDLAGSEAHVHYGLFDKFEAFERANPNDTQWALSMTEWR